MPQGRAGVGTVVVVAAGHRRRLGDSDITQKALLQAEPGPLQIWGKDKRSSKIKSRRYLQ